MSFVVDKRIPEVIALAEALRLELSAHILPYWLKYGRDSVNGGFWGTINGDNVGDPRESRSVVMTARHLWAYSAAASSLADPAWLEHAHWAYKALTGPFLDREFGGMFWSVTPDGKAGVVKKQVYGEAFAIYGLSEYAGALLSYGDSLRNSTLSGSLSGYPVPEEPLRLALELFELLELHARDHLYGGYVEARSRDWSLTRDLKLSNNDMDCDKSMNTNLHVMEAFTTLHRTLGTFISAYFGKAPIFSEVLGPRGSGAVVPGLTWSAESLIAARKRVGEALECLVDVTLEKILGADGHLDLYFSIDWKPIGDIVSYGHDIEASWLLWEAVQELSGGTCGEPDSGGEFAVAPLPGSLASSRNLACRWRSEILRIAQVVLEDGFDWKTGALENESHRGNRDRTRIWWCQAEALVGFFNAWEMSGERAFLDATLSVWKWIERFQADRVGGEWFWAVAPDGTSDRSKSKGGNWKTPYHNGRACMEIMRRAKEYQSL